MSTTSSTPVVSIDRLCVRYGKTVALDDVSLRVAPGTVYALLGRNGAGKSSFVRCLVGVQRPDAGSVSLLGLDAWVDRARAMRRTGVVPEDADAPPAQPVSRLIDFCARVDDGWDPAIVRERLRRHEIPLDAAFGNLSKGQKKLVSLALALGHTPDLLVLDDPTLGLDVAARRTLYEEIIGELADRGTTVLLTTHDLAGVEGIADRVGILLDGRLVVDDSVESLKRQHPSKAALEEIFLALTGRRAEVA